MNEFDDSARPIHGWSDLTDWLIESMCHMAVGDVLALAPGFGPTADPTDAAHAQLQVLADGVVWLRLSRTVLAIPLITDFSSRGLPLDTWQYDGRFDDCTHGYVFSRDYELLAEACVSWFRHRRPIVDHASLGCAYHPAAQLPRDG